MIHMWRNPAIMYMCSNLVSFHYTRGALSLYESEVNKFPHKAETKGTEEFGNDYFTGLRTLGHYAPIQ